MKIQKLYLLPLLLLALVGTAAEAKKKNPQRIMAQQISGPISQRSACPSCPNFACPGCNATGSTGSSGITGCTGAGCTACISPTGSIIPATFDCLTASFATIGSVNAGCVQNSGNVTVGLNADIKGSMVIQTDLLALANACMGRNLNVGDGITVAGDSVVLGALTAVDGAVISDSLVENGLLTVNGALSVAGSHSVGKTLLVNGPGSILGLLTASGGSSVYNGETLNGTLTIATGGASITGDTCITGDETVTGDFNVTNQLIVDEATILNNVTVGQTGVFTANGSVIMNDGLTIASGNEIISAGSLNIGTGTLSVGGTSSLQSLVTLNQGGIISGGLNVNCGSTISSGDLDVTLGSATFNGTLNIAGTTVSATGTSTLADVTITDTTNSLNTTTGSAIIAGGVGIKEDLWLGGSEFFNNVISEGGTPSAFDYYEEACFSTAFIWGGLTVNPQASVIIRIIRVGSVVNLLVPAIYINNPGVHIDVISSATPLPARFRPFTTIRGACSTILSTPSGKVVGALGEFNVSPAGTITFGFTGDALSPQRVTSTSFVGVDINTITYNLACSGNSVCT